MSRPLQLLAGLFIGLSGGVLLGGAADRLLPFVQPIGALWLNALTMTVVPLVFALLVTGVAQASREAAAGQTTARTLVFAALMLTAASVLAAPLADALLRLWPVSPGAVAGLAPPGAVPTAPPAAWYEGIIPTNPIKAAAETAMVPLVVFALFLGFALARIKATLAEAMLQPLRALVAAMLVIVDWVLLLGPLGIAALAFGASARAGADLLGTLGHYIVIVAACAFAAALLAYFWALLSGRAPLRFARMAAPAQAVALGTQSSLACLPVMVESVQTLGVRPSNAGIILPLAVSLFRASSVAANVAVTVYLAHLHGVPLGPAQLALVALVAVPVSLGAVGLPAQVSFFATIAPVCVAVGVPVDMLPLLLAIEAVPDLFRTFGNVTNDIALACLVDHGDPGEHRSSPSRR